MNAAELDRLITQNIAASIALLLLRRRVMLAAKKGSTDRSSAR